MTNSIESSRPILASRARSSPANTTAGRGLNRLSTYSASPSLTPSLTPSDATNPDPRTADIKTWNAGFDRLEDKRLASQRYVPSDAKTESLAKLALGAKLERALGRRMSEQDAVFTRRMPGVLREKVSEATATAGA